jgi:ribosomal protein L40E
VFAVTEEEAESESVEKEVQEDRVATATCYRCGAALPEGAGRCPQCGRRQTRLCYCGNIIPVTASECPLCHTDWSVAVRVRRRSRSEKCDLRMLAAYAIAGALATVALAAVVNSVIGALALRSLPAGHMGLPSSFGARVSLALTTVGRSISYVLSKLSSVGGGPWVAVIVAGSGALAGAAFYLHRIEALRLRWPLWGKRVRRRRA